MDLIHFPYRTSSLSPAYLQCAHFPPVETEVNISQVTWSIPRVPCWEFLTFLFCLICSSVLFWPHTMHRVLPIFSSEWIGIEWLYYQQCNDFSVGEPIQFSSVTQSCPTLCDPMNRSTRGLPVHHQLPEFTQTHVHWVSDAIQPPHPLSSPSPPAPNPSQHQSLFQWVNSSHEVAKVLKFQL